VFEHVVVAENMASDDLAMVLVLVHASAAVVDEG
jgi:hypothetical protein